MDTFIKQLSAPLFWEVDPEQVDPEAHWRFVIPRIMDRGTLRYVKAAWNYYGEERIQQALLKAASLHKKTIAFFANQFDLPRDFFRAYKKDTGAWNQ